MKFHFALILLCAATLVAIGTAVLINPRADSASTPGPARQVFEVKGVVRSLESDGVTVHIAHEEIPGFMPAMEMPFTVKDAGLLLGLTPGQPVSFELLVTAEDSWITRIQKTAAVRAEPAASGNAAARVETGEQVPDFSLVDQNGNPFRLRDLRGKAVLMTFIYTRCPLPNFCPLMSKNFAEVQTRLIKEGHGDKAQLVSVSFDPEFDTPAVLRRYADLYPHEGSNWTFATGTTNQVNYVTELFGLIRESANGLINHDLRTVLIDQNGRLVHVWRSNVWTPYEVHRRVLETLQPALAARR